MAFLAMLLLAAPSLAQPDLSVGAKEHPEADALILDWTQRFTLEEDGTIRRREHRWVKILDALAIRGFADPRIDYCEGEDEVIVHKAVTHLPDGTVMPVPEYSYNIAAPRDVAGWPAWAGWRQKIVSFSGLQPGAVIEFDWEVVTKAGVLPHLSAEIRMDADHPVLRHEVVLTVPAKTPVQVWTERCPEAEESGKDGCVVRRWVAKDPPSARRAEPQSLSWRERCSLLAFTTCAEGGPWALGLTKPVDEAAKPDDAIRAFAERAVGDALGREARIDAVIGRLRDTTHLVASPKTWRSRRCRPASKVFRTGYGSPLELAALAAAALRSVGYQVVAAPAVIDDPYGCQVDLMGDLAPDEAFAGCILFAGNDEESSLVHPRDGVLRIHGRFAGHTVMGAGWPGAGWTWPVRIEGRGDIDENVIDLRAHASIDAAGQVSGTAEIRLTGLFFDPAELATADAQKKHLQRIVARLVVGARVASVAMRELSVERLVATVTFALEKPLPKTDGLWLLELGKGPAFLPDVPMPLDRTVRRTDVRLKGFFSEKVDLVIELPEGAATAALPSARARTEGDWGSVEQTVRTEGRKVHLKRRILDVPRTVPAGEFGPLRDAVNALRAAGSRILAIRP
jgi:hypothetical protein